MRDELGDNAGKWWRTGTAGAVGVALATVVVHLATGWRYGFNRDELMALEDARHLAWGYVQYPPMTAFFGWLALKLFGTSLVGFRFFAALVQAIALVLTGLMAKEMGGGKWAQITAALAGVPFCLGGGALMQYISFDYVCWVMVAYGMVRILREENGNWKEDTKGEIRKSKTENPEEAPGAEVRPSRQAGVQQGDMGWWWVVLGVGMGLGMLAKYTMGLLVAGVVVAVLATKLRRWLARAWLWAGAAVASVIFLPNFLWQWRHGFVSLEFLRFLHERDVQTGVTDGFFVGQAELMMLALPLAVAGLWRCFFGEKTPPAETAYGASGPASEGGRYKSEPPHRALAWMYVVPLVVLVIVRGRDYYLAPAYPMLYAAGAVWLEEKTRSKEAKRQGSKDQTEDAPKSQMGRAREIGEQGGAVEILRPQTARSQDDRVALARDLDGRFVEVAQKATGFAQGARTALQASQSRRSRWIRRGIWVALALDAVVAAMVALPIAPVNSRWWREAARVDIVFPEEIGWEEFTQSVAEVWHTLPPNEKKQAAILAGNYGEVGALNLYGGRWGLPRVISGVNSSWERGYGGLAPQTLVVVGYPREFLEKYFASCQEGGRVWNRYGVKNEETIEDPVIFACRGLRGSWEEFWRAARKFA